MTNNSSRQELISIPWHENLSYKFANMAFICSVLVIGQHVMREHSIGSASWYIFQFFDCGLSRIAVPFFFLASGFFLSKHINEIGWYKNAVTKRIRTLILPFLVWNILWFFFQLLWRYVAFGTLVGGGGYACNRT